MEQMGLNASVLLLEVVDFLVVAGQQQPRKAKKWGAVQGRPGKPTNG
jgi:hypothetical protein